MKAWIIRLLLPTILVAAGLGSVAWTWALAQHVESSRYGPEYWKGVAQRDAALWSKATAFCGQRDAAEYPTCASVKMVEFFRANTQPARPPDSFTFRTDREPDTTRRREKP